MSVLALDSLVGGYGETEILHGVSLDVAAGEIVVIIGPNGAGKSTVMKSVFGLLNLSSGRVLLDDAEITNKRLSPCRNSRKWLKGPRYGNLRDDQSAARSMRRRTGTAFPSAFLQGVDERNVACAERRR